MHLQKLHNKCSGQLLATFFTTFFEAFHATFFTTFRAAFFEAFRVAFFEPFFEPFFKTFFAAFGEACRDPLIPSPFKYTYTQIAHGIHHPFFVFIQINLIFLLQSFPLVFGTVF